jgi:hypothetical protein
MHVGRSVWSESAALLRIRWRWWRETEYDAELAAIPTRAILLVAAATAIVAALIATGLQALVGVLEGGWQHNIVVGVLFVALFSAITFTECVVKRRRARRRIDADLPAATRST